MGKIRRIYLAIAAFALATQSMSMLISYPAHATGNVVSPDAMQNWQATYDAGSSIGFMTGLNTIGQGAVRFEVTDANQVASLQTTMHGGTRLADITALSYDSYRVSGADTDEPTLRIQVDRDVMDSDASGQGELVYMPQLSDSGQWQKQDARTGKWWFSDPAAFEGNCSYAAPCTIDQITSIYENIGIAHGGDVGFKVNASAAAVTMVDAFTINTAVYNFEPISAPQLNTPANVSAIQTGTLTNIWQAVPAASSYVFESYNDEAATQLRAHEIITDTQRTEMGIADGTTIWWRVKTIDAQGYEGPWSELWSVTIDTVADTVEAYPGVIAGGDDTTQELLTQLARLNEPFEIPNSIDASSPQLHSPVVTASDIRTLGEESKEPLATDKGVSTVAAIPTESGWKLFGVMWYWWVVIAGGSCMLIMRLIAGIGRRLAAQRDAYVARGYPYDQYES